MSALEIVGLIATVLTILGVVIGVAVRLSSFPAERKISTLESENLQLKEKLDSLAESQSKLVESLTLLKTASNDVQVLKGEIDQELQFLAQMAGVKTASILVPYPPSRDTRFAFLSILGSESNKLKNVLLDINKGIAGQVFASGNPKIVTSPKSDEKWNPVVDKRIAFQTQNLMCLPLKYGGLTIGVVQFLNKSEDFSEHDEHVLGQAINTLAFKVGNFTSHVENFEILGLGYGHDVNDGSVIYVDLSSSSSLLKGAHPLPKMDVINLINEYLEKLTITAINNGCIVDKYMWDGGLFSLNVAKTVPDHQVKAFRTALEMYHKFDELKSSWLRSDYPVNQLFIRVAISSGPILQADMGPAQYRQKTIVGDPIVAATALCANAPRNKNIIVIDEAVHAAISSDHIKNVSIPPSEMGKAQELIRAAYRIELPLQ